MTRVFTTGQVAKVFSVNINTVIKWFDEGKLEGFRLPRSNERRIYRESVLEFMDTHDIAPALLESFDLRASARSGRREAPTPAPEAERTGQELRNFERRPVDLPATVEDLGHPVPVMVRNLSMGGFYCTGFRAADQRIPEQFVVRVAPSEDGPVVAGTCQVVHLRRTRDDGFGLGCRFIQVDPGSLMSYLQKL